MPTFDFNTLKVFWADNRTGEISGAVWFSDDINCVGCDEYDAERFPNTGHQCEHGDEFRCTDEATVVVYSEPAGPDGSIDFIGDGPCEFMCARHIFKLLSGERWAKVEGAIKITS